MRIHTTFETDLRTYEASRLPASALTVEGHSEVTRRCKSEASVPCQIFSMSCHCCSYSVFEVILVVLAPNPGHFGLHAGAHYCMEREPSRIQTSKNRRTCEAAGTLGIKRLREDMNKLSCH
jgi:hypothetical protein